MRRRADSALAFIRHLSRRLQGASSTSSDIVSILNEIVSFVGDAEFRAHYPQYLQGTWYFDQINALAKLLSQYRSSLSWINTIAEVEGKDSVPIMTTHKSKGLEYHTVIFVGLEDSAHFNWRERPIEEKCGVFVSLSRAKRRVIFTFSGIRPTGKRGTLASQSRNDLGPIYDLLTKAGVTLEHIKD